MTPRPRIAFVSREVHPFRSGGIAPVVSGLARELGHVADVTVVTSGEYRQRCYALGGPAIVAGPGVEVIFVDEPVPDPQRGYASHAHDWSARLYEALATLGPFDLIEFCDYMAEGFVTLQARRTGDPLLRDTRVLVRAHTTAELASVLDGHLRDDNETLAVFEAERYCLRHADRFLHPGGDILDSYRRFYGPDAIAPGEQVLDAFLTHVPPPPAVPARSSPDAPLRLLYVGRLERRKGVMTLVKALTRTEPDDWRLTLVGDDTDTAPLGASVREHLELTVAGDHRIRFADAVPRNAVDTVMRAHDLVIMPSLWECWPNVVREAYASNRPVLATPVGGLTEMVQDGVSGWLARGATADALLAALEPLLRVPERVRERIASGAPRSAYDRLVDPERTRREYLALLPAASPDRRRCAHSGVSVVIPYHEMDAHIDATIASVRAQSRPVDEIVIVDDGSFRDEDAPLWRLADDSDVTLVAQPNCGLGAARNLGVTLARGRYVLPLDADNELEPEFVERCLLALEREPSLAYVTTWCRFVDEHGKPLDSAHEGHTPLGNWTRLIDRNNWAGDATAILRRELFQRGFRYSTELTSYEDWFLYRQLHRAGLHGDVVPRRLFRYRVRRDSMLRTLGLDRTPRLFGEMAALIVESETRWTASR